MPRTYADLLREARSQIREVSPQEVDALPEGSAAIIDVREASEWEQGHLPGAVHISKSYVEQQVEAAVPDKDSEVVLYCAGGAIRLDRGRGAAMIRLSGPRRRCRCTLPAGVCRNRR